MPAHQRQDAAERPSLSQPAAPMRKIIRSRPNEAVAHVVIRRALIAADVIAVLRHGGVGHEVLAVARGIYGVPPGVGNLVAEAVPVALREQHLQAN